MAAVRHLGFVKFEFFNESADVAQYAVLEANAKVNGSKCKKNLTI